MISKAGYEERAYFLKIFTGKSSIHQFISKPAHFDDFYRSIGKTGLSSNTTSTNNDSFDDFIISTNRYIVQPRYVLLGVKWKL
ncbi:MAG: hypothetical protein CO119_03115 [Flavobacteriales bacterium CG_4_9_14_3_um_filter_40_17]|nr:MAG: hypothetical protein CO119_03115 [Flavobacteriales bacterium CG_4_9_14_3_um_filter_40_17]